jgi:hypothetical protein
VAEKLRQLSAGLISAEEAGPAFSVQSNGAVRIRVDDETAALFPWRKNA